MNPNQRPTSPIGPPSGLYRVHYTRSKVGWQIERWNRFAGTWRYIGHSRQENIVKILVRVGVALWAPVADDR